MYSWDRENRQAVAWGGADLPRDLSPPVGTGIFTRWEESPGKQAGIPGIGLTSVSFLNKITAELSC